MSDAKVAAWVAAKLKRPHDRPFFLACGFFRPHLPWHVPRNYLSRFPVDGILLPRVFDGDLADVPGAGVKMARPERDHARVTAHGQWKNAVQGYLASVNFVDEMLGTVLSALEESGQAGNTVVVLWGDHGWHLGEKHHWRKFALWEEATRVPLLISAPPGTPGLPEGTSDGAVSPRPVNLLDLYPTLVDLAGIEAPDSLDGRSLVPLLRDPERRWQPSVSTYGRGNHSVRSEDFRYIRYADGTEELYDHRVDPMEWTNLAADANYQEEKRKLAPMATRGRRARRTESAAGSAHQRSSAPPVTKGAFTAVPLAGSVRRRALERSVKSARRGRAARAAGATGCIRWPDSIRTFPEADPGLLLMDARASLDSTRSRNEEPRGGSSDDRGSVEEGRRLRGQPYGLRHARFPTLFRLPIPSVTKTRRC